MTEPPPIVWALAHDLAAALEPLAAALRDPTSLRALLRRLGWEAESIPPEYSNLATLIDQALSSIDALPQDPGFLDAAKIVARVEAVHEAVRELSTAPPGVPVEEFLADIGESLLQVLFVDALARSMPRLFHLLRCLGIVTAERVPGTEDRPPFVRQRLVVDELVHVLETPSELPLRVYGWGTPTPHFDWIFGHVLELLTAARLPARLFRSDRELAEAYRGVELTWELGQFALVVPLVEAVLADTPVDLGVVVLPLAGDESSLPGIIVQPLLPGNANAELQIGERTWFRARAGTDLASTLGVALRPGGTAFRFPFQPDRPGATAAVDVRVEHAFETPGWRLGRREGTRFELAGFTVSLQLKAAADGLLVAAALAGNDGKLTISAQSLGSLLLRLIGDADVVVPLPLGIEWSTRNGLGLSGGTGEITMPATLSLGPLTLYRTTFLLKAGEGKAQLRGTAAASARLGPFLLGIDGFGLECTLDTADPKPLGVGRLGVEFALPTGVAIAIDSDLVTGGGVLSHDPSRDSYAGALAVRIGPVSAAAFALLETRLPAGASGFSLAALVTAQFPAVPLGFGFTLRGLGGILGLNRTADIDVLQAALHRGTLADLLFPSDAATRAMTIITELGKAFPTKAGRYVFGPMARIGWGPGPLVDAEIGLVLELPDPIRLILLGTIAGNFPRKDAALIEIHLDVLGEINPSQKRLALDGRLRDSKVASFTIEGEMALRLGWGEDSSFALSIGGFHPDFKPPMGFPKLERLTVPIGLDDNPRVTLQGYLALTSNTFQVGASADVYASAGWFNITGGVDFNALFQFSPFSFVADFSGRVTLRKGETDLAGVSLEATISGPSPWHAAGRACLHLKWLPDPCVGFEATFGNEQREDVPRVDPWPILQAAIENSQSYSAAPPQGAYGGATFARRESVAFDPGAGLTFRQSAVPLHRLLTRFGEAEPLGGPVEFDVVEVRLGEASAPWTAVTDRFAPAQFEPLSDPDKLSRPSFEKMDAGVTVATDEFAAGAQLVRPIEYETWIVDSAFSSRPAGIHRPDLATVEAALMAGSTADSPLRTSGVLGYTPAGTPPLVTLADELYVVGSTVDLRIRADISTPGEKGAVIAALAAHLAAHPEDESELQVVPLHEIAQAA